jgi:hypothetical protein
VHRFNGSRFGRCSVLILAVAALFLVGSRDIPQPAKTVSRMVSFRLHLELEATGDQCVDLSFVFRDQNGDILPAEENGTLASTTVDVSNDCAVEGDLMVSVPRALRYTVETAGKRFGPVSYDSIRSKGGVWRIGGFGA